MFVNGLRTAQASNYTVKETTKGAGQEGLRSMLSDQCWPQAPMLLPADSSEALGPQSSREKNKS